MIGGAGLVGSHVSRVVPDPLVLDDLSRGSFAFIGCDRVTASVNEYDLLELLVKRSDCVFFFAAVPLLTCDKEPERARRVMIDGLRETAMLCKRHGKRLVYSSSGSVYGENPCAKETDPLLGDNTYAKIKIEAEQVLTDSGCNFVGLRYMSVYGMAIQTGYKAVIQKYRETRGKLPVYGDGSQSYDFIYAEDVAEANRLAMKKGAGFYNIGTGVRTSILELAKMMGEPEFVDGYTPIQHMGCDPSKAERELGFRARTSLKEGLKQIGCVA